MSVPTSLTCLLPQLKSMEHSIISMIVELSSKLASLTEADVFVLVQNSEQRLISGNQSLIDLYLDGNLVPRGDDVEMEVPASSSVTLKRRHRASNGKDGAMIPSVSADDATTSIEGSVSGHASSAPQRRATPEPHRQLANDDGELLAKKIKQSPTMADVPLRRSSSFSVMNKDDEDDDVDNAIKTDSSAEEVDLTADDDDCDPLDDVSYFEEDYFAYQQRQQLFGSQPISVSLPFHLPSNPYNSVASHASFPHHSYHHQHHHHHHPASGLEPSSPSSIAATKDLLVNFDELNLPTQKMNFLKSVPDEDVERLFLKGTAESKVLTSVFYDFGKSLSNAFRSKDDSKTVEEHLAISKSFLNVNLNAFLEQFPNLQSDNVNRVRVHDMRPEAFLRLSARNGFKRGMKVKSKF